MLVSVVLCILWTTVFCACVRGWMQVAVKPQLGSSLTARGSSSYNLQARRILRSYWQFSLFILAVGSLVGAVSSYIDLFNQSVS